MSFLLVILLALSFAVVAAGFLLSPKPIMRSSSAVPRAVRPRRSVAIEPSRTQLGRVIDTTPARISRVVEPQPMRLRRSLVEGQVGAGVQISLPMLLERTYARERAGKHVPWTVISIGLISICVLGFYTLNLLLPHPALWSLITFSGNAPAATPPAQHQNAPQYNVSQNVMRLGQLDPDQYNSSGEYQLWGYSACSAAAMTEVINAYGHHFRVTDILQVEARIGEITPQLGLLEEVGIQRTLTRFGFKTTWGHSLSLDQIIDIANHGRPVIVSFPPDKYAGGHLLVVTGGNSSLVYLADSSLWNRHSLPRAQFLQWWGGFSAIATPA